MFREPLHPLDVPKVRLVAELLCDISEGRLLTREGLAALIASIMVCTSPFCSADGADGVLDRLLARADHRLGAAGMADIVLDEIAASQVRR